MNDDNKEPELQMTPGLLLVGLIVLVLILSMCTLGTAQIIFGD